MHNLSPAKGWLPSLFKSRSQLKRESRPAEQGREPLSGPEIDLGIDPVDDRPVFGFNLNAMFIHDPKVSECGRFEVDPKEYYGLTTEDVKSLQMLNEQLQAATQEAINAGTLAIQKSLGLTSSDSAVEYFSNTTHRGTITIALGLYMLQEIKKGTS